MRLDLTVLDITTKTESPPLHFTSTNSYQICKDGRAHQKEISERQKRMQVVCSAAATLLCIAKVVVEWPIAVAPSSSERLIYRCCPAWQQKNYYDVMPCCCWLCNVESATQPPQLCEVESHLRWHRVSSIYDIGCNLLHLSLSVRR
jgi:hypothetical protein